MAYQLSEFVGGAVLAVDGKMDGEFLVQVKSAISSGRSSVLINLEKSRAIRGDHMELMVEAHHLCRKAGGAMALTDVPKDFRYILSIMELDQFFRLFDTTAKGQEAFAPAPAPKAKPKPKVDAPPALAPGDVGELDVLELTPGSDAHEAAETETKTKAELRAEREMRIELFVRHVAPGMAYLYVFDALTKGRTRKFEIKGLTQASRQKASQVALVVDHLVELRICKPLKKGLFRYSPGQAAQEDIGEFLRMWNNPNNHGKVYKWVFAEEQVQKAEQQSSSLSSKLRRLFGKG